MICYNYHLLYCVIFTTNLLNYGFTLNVEKIVNGHIAIQSEFSYQVAIFGRLLNSTAEYLVCGGGIIHSYFILSAAHCFFDYFHLSTQYSYIVLAGTSNLRIAPPIRAEVDFIYIHEYDEQLFFTKDISVLKLRTGLDFDNNLYVSKLDLPDSDDVFESRSGRVSGYGANWILVEIDPETDAERVVATSSDDKLRYLFVNILNRTECLENYPLIDLNTQMCGKVPVRPGLAPAGFCTGDSGGPLVHGNKFIGIVNISPIDCDDTIIGGVYTKVSSYLEFIYAIFSGTPTSDTLVYDNPAYVSN